MWKRIQTLYLAISTGLIVSLFLCRYATDITLTGKEAVIMYYEYMPYLLMLIMLLTANIFAICSFKAPLLQARVSMISALVSLGFMVWLGIEFLLYRNQMIFSVTMLFPLLIAFLNFLAGRNAMVDGFTIRAAQRRRNQARNNNNKKRR
jgi:hypothetical protein